jgi:glycosyltransferase involved in cell wall biosynthesis
VLPSSYREGVPRIILEAMSMGRAIITTDSPGCRETVIDGKTGFLIKPKSTDELVSAMLKFVKNKDLIDKMGKKSRQLAEDKFDVHKVNKAMLKGMDIS